MPSYRQYQIVKQQIKSFEVLGIPAQFEIQNFACFCAPKIIIDNKYRFSDPDWNVVSRQLITLYKTLKNKIGVI